MKSLRFILPLLLRPKLLAVKNHLVHRVRRSPTLVVRDGVIALFSLLLMYMLYRGTVEMIGRLRLASAIAFIPPSLPLSLVLLFLLLILLFSCAVSALGALILSQDLELIFASPAPISRIFPAKFLEVLLSSSWTVLVFGAPVILGFGAAYHASFAYYAYAALALLPYFVIPAACAVAVVSLFTRSLPAQRTREVLLLCFAAVLVGIYLASKIIFERTAQIAGVNDMLQITAMLNAPNQVWVPAHWAAQVLSEQLIPSGKGCGPYLGLLYGTAGTCCALAYLSVRQFLRAAYSRTRSGSHGMKLNSRASQKMLRYLFPLLPTPVRAIAAKEFKLLARDMSQALQLLLLLALCLVYLYNFGALNTLAGLPEGMQRWWQGFLVLSNLALGAFVITAVCTRFVFPSISLEGHAYWILQSSPLRPIQVLYAKLTAWYLPVALISSIIFASGAFAIDAEPRIVGVSVLSCWIMSYGLVGLAVGLGALFAHFSWEHASQIAASFGSLIYMLAGALLIGADMALAGALIVFRTLRSLGVQFSLVEWYASVICCAALFVYLNFAVTRWALRLGERALIEQMR